MTFWVECDLCGKKAPHFPEIIVETVPAQWHTGVACGLACELDVSEICPSCLSALRHITRRWDAVKSFIIEEIAKDAERVCSGS